MNEQYLSPPQAEDFHLHVFDPSLSPLEEMRQNNVTGRKGHINFSNGGYVEIWFKNGKAAWLTEIEGELIGNIFPCADQRLLKVNVPGSMVEMLVNDAKKTLNKRLNPSLLQRIRLKFKRAI